MSAVFHQINLLFCVLVRSLSTDTRKMSKQNEKCSRGGRKSWSPPKMASVFVYLKGAHLETQGLNLSLLPLFFYRKIGSTFEENLLDVE